MLYLIYSGCIFLAGLIFSLLRQSLLPQSGAHLYMSQWTGAMWREHNCRSTEMWDLSWMF